MNYVFFLENVRIVKMCHKSKHCPCGNKAGMCQFDVDKILDEVYNE